MKRISLILAVFTLLLIGAGCASKTQQGAVSASAKDWQHVPPSPGYIAFMKSHPIGPPAAPAPPAGAAKAASAPANAGGPAAIH